MRDYVNQNTALSTRVEQSHPPTQFAGRQAAGMATSREQYRFGLQPGDRSQTITFSPLLPRAAEMPAACRGNTGLKSR
jgi:hypothetical protein